MSFIAGWLRGGVPERCAVAALICDFAFTGLVSRTSVGETGAAASTFVVTLIVIWLAFRADRWWLFVAAASLILCVMTHVMEWVGPALSQYAAESAQLGLWIAGNLSLSAGAGERWLAGERATSDYQVWAPRRA